MLPAVTTFFLVIYLLLAKIEEGKWDTFIVVKEARNRNRK
jgi:hypothetical protein